MRKKEEEFDVNAEIFKSFESVLPVCCDCHVVSVYVRSKEMKNGAF
jgi:hypothetical protein